MRYLALALLLLTLTGCMNGGLPALVEALAHDQATSCTTVTTIYGTGRIYRTNAPNATVSCSPDGMTVKSGSQQQAVP